MTEIKKSFTPKVVLGIAAHPDDLDFSSSGSMAKWVKDGAKAYYLILTDGSKGSADPSMTSKQLIDIRRDEQRAAAKILGVSGVYFLDYEDGFLENTRAVKCDVSRIIRKVKPDTVVTMDPTQVYSIETGFINHSDHRVAGQVALDCVYPLARDRLAFPELESEGCEPHKVKTVLMTNFSKRNQFIDISDTFDTKIKALIAHDSQIPDIDSVTERMKEWGAMAGKEIGVKYAEGFIRIDLPF